MDLPYREFAGGNANFNYAVATLIMYYFIHMDGQGDAANLKAYKRALLDGKDEAEATEILLAGRTMEELADEIQSAWRRYGVRINYRH